MGLPPSAGLICLLPFCQLTVGLYEFEVTVDGEGAYGKGYVNVTVKPGECEKKDHLQHFFPSLAIQHVFPFHPLFILIENVIIDALTKG